MSDKLIPTGAEYSDIISIIDGARYRAQKAVNAEMIQMYWDIGHYVSERVNDGGWGKNIVKEFAAFLQSHYPSAKGFSAQNIWRMKPGPWTVPSLSFTAAPNGSALTSASW